MDSTVNEAELHAFAKKIGLKKEWYQNKGGHPHYDLTTKRKINQALKAGAKQVQTKEILNRAWWAKK